jgi:hypothetical protein
MVRVDADVIFLLNIDTAISAWRLCPPSSIGRRLALAPALQRPAPVTVDLRPSRRLPLCGVLPLLRMSR